MKVEIWSDIICPFCYIGKRRFEAGLQAFAHRDQVKVVYRSFQLDPTIAIHPDKHLFEIAAAKEGTSTEVMAKVSRDIAERAKQDGLLFNYDTVKHTNTMDAHRLSHFAMEYGKEEAVLELLYKAYFTDSLHIGEHETLLSLAEQAGLDHQETVDMLLDSKRYLTAVKEDQLAAKRLGVRGVPYFLINNRYAISGAQPVGAFIQALEAAWKEVSSSQKDEDSDMCSDGIC
ncbi:DsbA family oxidoreductase [Cohnella lupini]|uniref:Putative DsbA family dithiol-disulfide isomerase n=1 Tax=Cohnella lupini TaxID=1294267 RepID=A0A3D9IJ85_9BACL|nr:DsbA family oxidoreductase [Cohnella lupini]RED61854.1 putative DsbA family dithiol-disulfide isomerase [Cohnella lupini]